MADERKFNEGEPVKNRVNCGHCGAELELQCARTRDTSGFYLVECPACRQLNHAMPLSGDPIGNPQIVPPSRRVT